MLAGWIDEKFCCWAVAKLVRHQALDLAFEGSSPSRPAIGLRSDFGVTDHAKRRAFRPLAAPRPDPHSLVSAATVRSAHGGRRSLRRAAEVETLRAPSRF